MDKFEQVEKIRNTGVSIRDACKQVGLTYAKWHYRKYKAGKVNSTRRIRPELTEIPVNNSGKLMVIIGNYSDVSNAIRGIL